MGENQRVSDLKLHLCVRHVYSSDAKIVGEMRVFCPDKASSVRVEQCLGCPRWNGLFVEAHERNSFVQCSPHNRPPLTSLTSDDARVASVMTPSVVCVRPELSVQAVLDIFLNQNISGAPVVDEYGKVLGVVSKTDLLGAKNLAIDISDPERTPETVEEVMTPLAFSIRENAAVSQAAGLMAIEGVHRLMVVAPDGSLVGILSAIDVMRWLAERDGYGSPVSKAANAL